MRGRRVTAIGTISLLALTGCSAMRDRRWGWCAVGGGVIGAAMGAGTAGGLVNAYGRPEHDEGNTGAAAAREGDEARNRG